MENASKALLIAGAILIAILLIAIGMMVYNSASGVVDSAASNMSSQEKTMFNKQWTIYEGTQSGSVANEIVTAIRTNNSDDDNPDITLNGSETIEMDITRQSTYDVEVDIDQDTGLVSNIDISL